jgi:hypothetical protein
MTMRTRIVVKILLLTAVLVLGLHLGWGQEAKAKTDEARTKADEPKPVVPYRLDFSVNEIEDGKRINARQYSMNLNAGDANTIKIGTRVPVEMNQGTFQYLDVGTNIFARLGHDQDVLPLEVRAEISNFAMADQQNQSARPLLRQMQINGSTVVMLGKPTVIGSVDDPNSKRQFQLVVTATRLR